ncbi:MAG: recombination protein RecR [Francisellaceae bacterium]|jgi:recombination protein RecR|nr:recombination protein RecR [Francisellaceae bacterium]MBT6207253.1 recombination protein RecR [Francisellaceae bacterium]MBT6539614.1 recombination protein RecR [Francisellaceae bacterium]
MQYTPLIRELLKALQCLPGVGPKTAQRMAFYLLERNRDNGRLLAKTLDSAMDNVTNCSKCRMLSESKYCQICLDHMRDEQYLCVVESPADVVALESAGGYKGRYFILMGCLSPIDGIGPDEIGVPEYKELLSNANINEVILATSSTVEGDTTAHFLSEMAISAGKRTTRIAHGIPVGGELEQLDPRTLYRALANRTKVS